MNPQRTSLSEAEQSREPDASKNSICRVCEKALREPTPERHVAERSIFGDLCLGCFVAIVELEKFLLRAHDRTMMGAWAEGYLRAVLKDPKRFRGDNPPPSGPVATHMLELTTNELLRLDRFLPAMCGVTHTRRKITKSWTDEDQAALKAIRVKLANLRKGSES